MKTAAEVFGKCHQAAPAPRPTARQTGSGGCGSCKGGGSEALLAPAFAGWRGQSGVRKPWEYRVTAAMAHLNTVEPLRACIDVLRRQTERPYILVIDTGSPLKVRCELEALRAPDVEVHYIGGHAYEHSSEAVATALDLAHLRCQSEYLYHTHTDCFLKRDNFIADLVGRCSSEQPVIGYRMSPRDWATNEWEWMVSHTATLLHMPTVRTAGAWWSMRRAHERHGMPWASGHNGWPDTETGFNYDLRAAGIDPVLIGEETNFEIQETADFIHVRSHAGSKVYEPGYHTKADGWMRDTLARVRARLSQS